MRIFHCFLNESSFVRNDGVLLRKAGPVQDLRLSFRRKWMLPFAFLKQLIDLLVRGRKADVFIIQFAGYHSFLPCLFARLTGKKSVIIAGGTDCVSFPGIGYGNFYRPFLRTFTRWSYRLCTMIAPKHDSLWDSEYRYDAKEPSRQGIKAFVPGIDEKYWVIRNGYDITKWTPCPDTVRTPGSFITLSGAFEYPFQVSLKGIDLILAAAPLFPDCTFTIAGVPPWKKLDVKSDNVHVLPPVNHDELPALFNRHSFYLQLSMAEGFPNALCEAMLCGCTPIVSGVFSMPEIVGADGYVLEKRDTELLRRLIEKALRQGPASPEANHRLIAERYPAGRRERELRELIMSLGGR